MDVTGYLYSVSSAVYATLAVLIAVQARQKANAILSLCCAVTALWAASGAIWGPVHLEGPVGFLDITRLLTWYMYLLHLYQRSQAASRVQIRGFSAVACAALTVGLWLTLTTFKPDSIYTISSPPVAIRLLVCISELLLIENLYFNLPEGMRWHITLPCILLAGLACFDILVVADTALFRRPSIPLESGRVVAMILVAPLLVLAAFRGQRWSEPIRLSRTAVFHSATLVLSGSVLLSLALVGEVLRHVDAIWGWVAELSLVFAGLVGIMLFVSSRSARSLIDRMIVSHFFADRFDYRSQWLSCIDTLSGSDRAEQSSLHTRVIKAVADVVDSPCGSLFRLDAAGASMVWSGSWNMPTTTSVSMSHPLLRALVNDKQVVDLQKSSDHFHSNDAIGQLGPVWLAVALRHVNSLVGLIIVGQPRIPFRVDQEVADLLGILGREVGTYLAEQQATEAVFQTRSLHDYGKRFAFVAHDIKNVSSQLALLLANAELHITNPEFQEDMLTTVRASVQKIDRLLRRLDEPSTKLPPSTVSLTHRIDVLVQTYSGTGISNLTFEHDGSNPQIVVACEAFDTAVGHLVNNAIEASPTSPVLIKLAREGDVATVEIKDHGKGMSQEFIRDELFFPFKTRRAGGSGIGAFQARELINEAGGELEVVSERGAGTTMRIRFPCLIDAESSTLHTLMLKTAGDASG